MRIGRREEQTALAPRMGTSGLVAVASSLSVCMVALASFWDVYQAPLLGLLCLCAIEAVLIVGLLAQGSNLRRAEHALRESQRELRVLTGKLLQAQETERRRIARELHDDLSQNLALLSVELEVAGQNPPESASQHTDRMRELSSRVKQLSRSVHSLSHQLHPSKLEQLGLVAAMRGLCGELSQNHGLPIDFNHCKAPDTIAEDAALCLYRIVQEALGNVLKHSGARHARVELTATEETICLRIVDDGVGFDPPSVEGKGGLGLVSMRERLRLVKGDLTIDSRPSGGTRVNVAVPRRSKLTPLAVHTLVQTS